MVGGAGIETVDRSGANRADRNAGRGMMIGGGLFRPSPEDFAPLTKEEREELMTFLQEHVSGLHAALEKLREGDPAAFEQKMNEAAPRLRQLRRIFERNPELGQLVLEHSDNMKRIHRGWRAWRGAEGDKEQRDKLWGQIRRMVAQNLRIEIQVAEDRASEIEQQREERVAAEVERLLSERGAFGRRVGPRARDHRRLARRRGGRGSGRSFARSWWISAASAWIARLRACASAPSNSARTPVEKSTGGWNTGANAARRNAAGVGRMARVSGRSGEKTGTSGGLSFGFS